MDAAEIATLPRRVGRMKHEQVRTLFDENRRQRKAHDEAVARGEYCPECRWRVECEYARCEEALAVFDASRAAGGSLSDANRARSRHWKTCQTCQTVVQEWTQLDYCTAAVRRRHIEQVYSRRLHHLAATETGEVSA